MLATDFLCDFCAKPWSEERPFIEGHHGSCICGNCLRTALREVGPACATASLPAAVSTPPAASHPPCTMCLEPRDEPGWSSPVRSAWICTRCLDQARTVLSKDRSIGWKP